ncbi:MAG: hypothetical protein J0I48_05710 [Devosia sp.]|uniref:DUF6384 family protein n=1 Tax=Devosia sp. 66-22 TaxID=1895753 RepID=UPI001AC2ED91|nr:DUF6384 family protein [Devosia sp. 66-22]MBN9345691.1 hypothetical protein [Devosia sp.]
MSATEPMSAATTADKAPLDDVMLAMDVVDTLRHNQDLVARELAGEAREKQLIERLRTIYHQQGIEVTDAILKQGVAALEESRFVYTPPKPSLGVSFARLYVARKRWLPAAFALFLMLAIGLGGYFLVWAPYRAAQQEQVRVELAEQMPAQMDALYQTIFEETKVTQAADDAALIRDRGKRAAAEGDRAGATQAIADLTSIRDTLRQEYQLRVVSRDGAKSGFWTFPEVNTEATNYYVVVEAIDSHGVALKLPILNEENNQTETVDIWGIRVPESVYRAVEADKRDDGIIQRNIVGLKEFGYLDPSYLIQVLGGAVTRW